ncbi:hypothetical protein ISG01_31045, partial [Burkholderia pseudomallei]|uniref:hypothetical protein n=3 Tax=Burkholderia pseudomallei TaxID=28450 RepID=UPI0019FA8325
RPFRASLSSAQDHEHDISNAPLATPVYTVSNFNSLLEAVEGDAEGQSLLAILKAQYEPDQLPAKILGAIIDGSFETHEEVRSVLGVQEADYRNAWKVLMRAATKLEPKE